MKQKTEKSETLEDITRAWEKAKMALAPATRNIRKKKLLINGPCIKRRTK